MLLVSSFLVACFSLSCITDMAFNIKYNSDKKFKDFAEIIEGAPEIGKGSEGTVYVIPWRPSPNKSIFTTAAMKKSNSKNEENLVKEIEMYEILQKIGSSVFPEYYECVIFNNEKYLITEMLPYSMKMLMDEKKNKNEFSKIEWFINLKPLDYLNILLQILTAVKIIHDEGYVHHDIKPSNLYVSMVDGKLSVKLADFGSSSNACEWVPGGTFGYCDEYKNYILSKNSNSAQQKIATDIQNRSDHHIADFFALGMTFTYLVDGSFRIYEAIRKNQINDTKKIADALRESVAIFNWEIHNLDLCSKEGESCLFSLVNELVKSRDNMLLSVEEAILKLEEIMKSPIKFSKLFPGKKRSDYKETINKPRDITKPKFSLGGYSSEEEEFKRISTRARDFSDESSPGEDPYKRIKKFLI